MRLCLGVILRHIFKLLKHQAAINFKSVNVLKFGTVVSCQKVMTNSPNSDLLKKKQPDQNLHGKHFKSSSPENHHFI